MRVLIVEDDRAIAGKLKHLLEKNRFTVDLTRDDSIARKYIFNMPYNVIVLDVSLPGMAELALLSQMRENGIYTPVLLQSDQCEVEKKVMGLEKGADDYLIRPYASEEFVARVKALARRQGKYIDEKIGFGNVTLDVNSYAMIIDGQKIPLNNKEFQLFELFMRHPANIFSSQYLLDLIWGLDTSPNINVVWTHIGFLRRKLKDNNASIEIRTIRGAGYMLNLKKDKNNLIN